MLILSDTLFAIGLVFAVFFVYSLTREGNRFAPLFAMMCLSVAVYVIGYAFELRSKTLEEISFFLKMEYFGQPFMCACWMLLAYTFRYKKAPSAPVSIAVFLTPVFVLFFSVTNEFHHLFYANVSAEMVDGLLLARLTKGPVYYVNVFYSYAVFLIGIFIFYSAWRKAQYKTKTQAFWLLVGSIMPGVANLIYLLGLSPLGLDLNPFAFGLLAICFYNAMFRYDFLDLTDIVRSVAFSEIQEGILVLDAKNRLVDFNRAAQQYFPWAKDINVGTDIAHFDFASSIINVEDNRFEMAVETAGGTKYCEIRVTVLDKGKVLGFVYFIRDITKEKDMLHELENMASYDPLTQVYNRRRLMEEAEEELRRARRYGWDVSVLMIDLDHFKDINDKYGHLVGDEVIRRVIQVCTGLIRSTDVIGRYGGEEFIVILPDTKIEKASIVAEKMRSHIAGLEVTIEEANIHITVSVGVACLPNGEQQKVQEIINWADQALYQAKNNGRNQVFCFQYEHKAV